MSHPDNYNNQHFLTGLGVDNLQHPVMSILKMKSSSTRSLCVAISTQHFQGWVDEKNIAPWQKT
jgi:hypothetical protein